MSKENTIFDSLRLFSLWLSPVIMIAGSLLLLLSSGAYGSLEEKLGKELGGIKKKMAPLLETNIDFVHKWALAHKRTVGLVFMVCSFLIFYLLRK
jgi:hypothetical protein